MIQADSKSKAQAEKPKRYTVGPSQLGWLLADCERCFVREVAHGVRRPGRPPDAFNIADQAMKRRFDVGPEIVHDLGVGPQFTVIAQGLHVESCGYLDESDVEIVIKGRLDALVRTTAGDVIVVDYKTMTRSDVESGARAYSSQLRAYEFALRFPKLAQQKTHVDGLALLVYHPSQFAYRAVKQIGGLYGVTDWVEVPQDDEKFHDLLHRVAQLLICEIQPKPNPMCGYCTYYGAVPLTIPAQSSGGVQ